MFRLIKQLFIGRLASITNTSNHSKCVFLNEQQCMIQLTLTNLPLNEYGQGLCYYPFAINLDKCVGRCNPLNDLSNTLCVQDKTEDLNLNIF